MILTEERQYGVMKKEQDEGWIPTSAAEKFERPKKKLKRWRHVMELPLPCHGRDWQKLWLFVAAHVEDESRKKPCPLAVKAWQLVCKREKVAYSERSDKAVLPLVMPLFRQVKTDESEFEVVFGEGSA
jgi:hypothetical protein